MMTARSLRTAFAFYMVRWSPKFSAVAVLVVSDAVGDLMHGIPEPSAHISLE